jgi:hypothetical protein
MEKHDGNSLIYRKEKNKSCLGSPVSYMSSFLLPPGDLSLLILVDVQLIHNHRSRQQALMIGVAEKDDGGESSTSETAAIYTSEMGNLMMHAKWEKIAGGNFREIIHAYTFLYLPTHSTDRAF